MEVTLPQSTYPFSLRNLENKLTLRSRYFSRLKLNYPQADTNKASRRFVKAMKRLDVCITNPRPEKPEKHADAKQKEIIPSNGPSGDFYHLFIDLLRKIFVYDPVKRITAKQALQHPWFKLVCPEDDGTEAVKFRQDSMKREAAERRAREYREGQRLAPIHIS